MKLSGSFGLECRSLLIVKVLSSCLHLVSLLLLSGFGSLSHGSLCALVGTICQNLLAAQMLLLHGPHAVFVLGLFLRHLSFLHLALSFVHDLLTLLCVHALEMVGLDSVCAQH